jgi:hypothetical protein
LNLNFPFNDKRKVKERRNETGGFGEIEGTFIKSLVRGKGCCKAA